MEALLDCLFMYCAFSYFSKSVIKATSDEPTGVLENELQKRLCCNYEEGNLSMTVVPQDVTVTHFGTPDFCQYFLHGVQGMHMRLLTPILTTMRHNDKLQVAGPSSKLRNPSYKGGAGDGKSLG